MNDIISELRWRGLIHQLTNENSIADWLMEQSRTVYAGFDPTADSLHVGHLVALMNLRRFQQCGHRPIALAGGATGTIGDPSGKSDERKLITKEQVEYNIKCIEKQLRTFLRFDHSPTGAVIVNNADWFSQFSYIDFLRDVGKHFPVNVMLAKESVKLRLENNESGLSFTEFSYMLMQSYDFVHLYKTYKCEMQIGGSDQWGNITMGCDFARRVGVLQQSGQLQGLTSPLLTKSDGTKMGKTEGGALWLDPNKTPPYQFYQYWINLDDTDVEKTLKIFTGLPQEAIAEAVAQHNIDPGRRLGQRKVADELTQLVHGESGLAVAKKATDIFFGGEITALNDAALASIFADVPSKELPRSHLETGFPLVDALTAAGLTGSKSEARRTVQQGGAYVNNRQITDVNAVLTLEHLASESLAVIRSGKKKYALLKFV
ncbi:MAG: tyrosine--tRNA ligase [Planctomycetaceae bacterium]|jgi:tyrosyl-tRNA synthetase|nr:tyrosine--tRNA ligase [Planctomycetaceae bacterium]